MRGSFHRHARLAVAVLVVAVAAQARGEASAQAQLGYSDTSTSSTDPTGATSRYDTQALLQQYRLSLDERLFPLVSVSASGLYWWNLGWTKLGGLWSESDSRRWNVAARLTVGGPMLNGGADYSRNEQSGSSTVLGKTLSSPTVVGEAYGAYASWRPADLPSLDLRYTHTATYDEARQTNDTTTDEALLSSRFQPDPRLDLRYSLRYAVTEDHIHGVETQEVDNSFAGSWSDTYLEKRGNYYVNYQATTRNSRTSVSGTGGTVATQRFPTAGLSIVEAFPAVPTRVTLNQNPALIDGVTAPAANAGIDLGWGRSLAGDVAYRDLGAQFANAVTQVNTIYVWVDKQLQAPVWQAFTWDVYRSDDNVDWTLVRGGAAAVFSPVQNRFEITIDQAQARYLKVVAKPLPAAFASDPRVTDPGPYKEIFVTEVQFFLVVAASSVRGSLFDFSETLSGTTRVQLLRSPALSYDLSVFLTHAIEPSLVTYSVVNGLSLTQRLSRVFGLGARLERTDQDEGVGHESVNRWSASLIGDFLPTLSAGLNYSGSVTQQQIGTTINNAAGAFGRADLYQGVSVFGNLAASLARNPAGQETTSASGSASLALVPNRILTLNGGASWSWTEVTGGGRPASYDRRASLDASAAFNPFPALALAGSIARFISLTTPPSTIASFTGGFSPFPGGDLQLRYTYTETVETSSAAKTITHGPGLRWNIRRGSYLDAGYTFFDSSSISGQLSSRSLFANLVITLL